MYNDTNKTILSDLGKRKLAISNIIVGLASQGYSVNSRKLCKLSYAVILGHIFRQLPLYDNIQSINARMFYNKFGEK